MNRASQPFYIQAVSTTYTIWKFSCTTWRPITFFFTYKKIYSKVYIIPYTFMYTSYTFIYIYVYEAFYYERYNSQSWKYKYFMRRSKICTINYYLYCSLLYFLCKATFRSRELHELPFTLNSSNMFENII